MFLRHIHYISRTQSPQFPSGYNTEWLTETSSIMAESTIGWRGKSTIMGA